MESLSDDDLRAIAERMGLGLPPDLDRVFIVEEIVEALEEDSLERGPGAQKPLYVEDAKYWCRDESDTVPDCLPKLEPRYNETSIKALVRDPSWAFALWNLAESDRDSLELGREEAQLFLRITEISDIDSEPSLFFDIPITLDDLQWYINLPHPEARYRIDLMTKLGARARVLARSAEIAVPRQNMDPEKRPPEIRRLLELSGIGDFDIEMVDEDNPRRILRSSVSGRD